MRKDYKTIREVVGPLMTVDHVAGVKYDELVEIHQANGEVRSGRVLVIDGDRALVQLFESSQGLQASTAKARFRRTRDPARCFSGYAGPRLRRYGQPH